MTGLAQKGGAVFSHIRIAKRPEDISAVRIATGGARLLLGCDVLVAASADGLARIERGQTVAVINGAETITGGFTTDPDLRFPTEATHAALVEATGSEAIDFVDASRLAVRLLGDSIGANLFMLGYAWQRGLVPLSAESIDRAIELNGVSVAFNRRAFTWGRRAACDLAAVEAVAKPRAAKGGSRKLSDSLDEMIDRRVRQLSAYQDGAYAERYLGLVSRVREAESQRLGGRTALTEAVVRSLYKLMAYKDEYEVARLYTDGRFERRLHEMFEGEFTLEFHLAPPLLADREPGTGHLKKKSYGPWMMKAFRVLAGLKSLRGTRLDIFGYSAERRTERRLIGEYIGVIEEILQRLGPDTYAIALELARIPEKIRGFGHVKLANLDEARKAQTQLLARLRSPTPSAVAAE
jgi:indolepyruvate ferredoxin oxidoreductase